MDDFSTLLFARPSFLEGIGRSIDLGATMQEYNTSPSPEQADDTALQSDWEAINGDFAAIIEMPTDRVKEFASDSR